MIRFPLRVDRPVNRKTQFTVHSSYKFKGFFFLICSELGDLFKIEFLTKDGQTKDHKQIISIKIEYFYTVSCLTSMCLSKNGFLFCASEREDQYYMYYAAVCTILVLMICLPTKPYIHIRRWHTTTLCNSNLEPTVLTFSRLLTQSNNMVLQQISKWQT